MNHEPKVYEPEVAFEDERGYIINIVEHSTFAHVAIISSASGSIRGNHYHPDQAQWLYVVSGRMVTRAVDVISGQRWNHYVEKKHMEYMPPGIAHAYYFPKNTLMLNITPFGRRHEDGSDIQGVTVPWEVWRGPNPSE